MIGSNPSRNATYVVLTTFAAQAAVTMTNSTLPTIAPEVAQDLGLDAALVGYQVSILFGGAVVGTLFGGRFVARYGAGCTMQMSAALSAAGMLVILIPSLAAIVAITAVAGGTLLVIARRAAAVRHAG